MYKFVKVKDIKTGIVYKQWYLYCDTIETLNDHWYKIIVSDIKTGIHHMIADPTLIGHSISNFANTCKEINKLTNHSLLRVATDLEIRTYMDRHKSIVKGDILLLTNGLQYMTMAKDFEIIESMEKSVLDYVSTQFTTSDIKITRWPNGKHYYAKIGTYDVKDDMDDMKWNTYKAAECAAIKFLDNLYE